MKKSIKFTIETQTENNEVISVCHINEKTISLEISDVARKMFQLNKTLFAQLNNTTRLLSGKLFREEIKFAKEEKNKLGVKLMNKYEHREVEIMTINFNQEFMSKKQSVLTKNGRRIDFDPQGLAYKKELGPLDPNNLTYNDVKLSKMICEMEEIQLFQGQGIKSYIIKDFMEDAKGLNQTAYRIEVQAHSEFDEYLNYILRELERSILFLTSYQNSATSLINYSKKRLEFEKSFKQSILNQLGLSENLTSVNLGSERIKTSQFGKAALDFYNSALLLSPNVEKNIYGKILKNLLPTPKTNPEIILKTVENFRRLYRDIKNQYKSFNKDSKSSTIKSKILSKTRRPKNFVMETTEKITIQQQTLGYNIFSEKQKGLNRFSISSYRTRIGAERAKYYPSISVADETNFMTSVEKSVFASNANVSSFVTPANLIYGQNTISCARGMVNMDLDKVREFRISKSAMAIQINTTNYPSPSPVSGLSKNVMSDFNITIARPVDAILKRGADIEIDPLQDAKNYVGEASYFVTTNPELIIKNFKNLLRRDDRRIFSIVSDVIPGTLLTKKSSIKSIKDLQLSNKNSNFRNLVSTNRINLEEIPPQIKAMMSTQFQTNQNVDPLKNRESRAIIDETQKNIFLVRAHTGYELDEDGFPDLNRPIIEDMHKASSGGRPILAKAYNYEVPELGIVKDKYMPTIYNNLIYVQG